MGERKGREGNRDGVGERALGSQVKDRVIKKQLLLGTGTHTPRTWGGRGSSITSPSPQREIKRKNAGTIIISLVRVHVTW